MEMSNVPLRTTNEPTMLTRRMHSQSKANGLWGWFPSLSELIHFTLGLNRGHEHTSFYHLTWSMVAVIYNCNFQHGWGG